MFPKTPAIVALAIAACPVRAQTAAVVALPQVDIVSVAPLPGIGLSRNQVAANVQTADATDIEQLHALDLASLLARSFGSVNINALQGNPFQPDVNYRGFTASPLLGTPQGLSIYMDGVRLNQPFGDVVGWDLIPRAAIAGVTLMPGSNPLFGLNTLGGALSVTTRDGLHDAGTSVEATAGSHRRASIEFETGGQATDGLHWFVTGTRLHEQGWREASPSGVSQLFAKIGQHAAATDVALTTSLAETDLTGNGTQELGALQRDRRSVYTIPDTTRNRSLLLNLTATHRLAGDLALSGNAWYRNIRTATVNGDVNDDALGESLYQPTAAEQATLRSAGETGVPAAGANAANTPFPKWRCIADALQDSEPNEKCDGLINRTSTRQQDWGVSGQVTLERQWAGVAHRLLVGAGWDASRVRFTQSAQYGYLGPDASVTPVTGPGAFADGTQASEDAVDSRVDLASRSHTASAFASDTVTLDARTTLTLAGRYNRNAVHDADGITPGGGPGSLDGRFVFSRFNPALGLAFDATPMLTAYAGIDQGSRAPTATELGCADPATPCKLPNSFAGDPPLRQVVTTTVEAGLRGRVGQALSWNAGVFRSDNRDDLLFVSDSASGFGYFRNVGRTRRQGIELGLAARPVEAVHLAANLSVLDATYRSAEVIDGSANSSNASARAGFPGTDGTIAIQPGDRIPLLPRRLLKLRADWAASTRWRVGLDMTASAGANARGNENGLHQPDGVYFTGPGRSAGYAVLDMDLDFRPVPRIKLFADIANLLNRRYATAAQLGANAFDSQGHVAARALPRNANGDFPVASGTFLAPGAPRTFWLGVRLTLGS